MPEAGAADSINTVVSRVLRRVLRVTAWSVAALLLIVTLALLYVTFVGISVDASFLRAPIAQTFSDSIGRPVRFEGAMEIRISARPELRIGGLRVGNPPRFGDGDFATLGEAHLAVDLWPLLFGGQLHIEELSGSNVQLHLRTREDGSNNWTLHRPKRSAAAPATDKDAPTISAQRALALLDIQQIALRNVNVEYVGADGKSHFFSLHSLTAKSPANDPLELALYGTVGKEFPYQLELTGGNLSQLAADAPWPVAFTLTFLSSTLTVDGHINGAASGQLTMGLGTENLLEFERLLQTDLPDVGPSGIAANVTFSPHRVAVRQLAGAMGNTTLTGELDFDTSTAKTKLSGSLVAPTLDLRPFIGEQATGNEQAADAAVGDAPPRNLAELYRSLADASFDLRRLNDIDADVSLAVERWLSLPGDVKDARLQIKLHNGILQAPLTASIAGVTFAGRADADASASPPKFDLALATGDSDLGGLADLLTGVPGVEGRLQRFALNLSAQGNQGSELVRSLAVELQIDSGRFSYGNIADGRPVNFELDKLAVRLPAGEELAGTMHGTLLGNPFSATLSAGALEAVMLQGRSPLDLRMRSGNIWARVEGSVEPLAADRGPDIAFAFSAPRAGDLANWLGFKPGTAAPVALTGKARVRANTWQVSNFLLAVGSSSLTANLSRTVSNGAPLLTLRLESGQIDVAQLDAMIPRPDTPKATPGRPALEIPLLPREIDLSDADIAVRIKRLSGTAIQVREISFDGRIRDGYMHPSPFAANVAETVFSGAVLLDLRGTEPVAGLWLYAASIDVGKLLQTLDAARALEARFDELALNITARSSRLIDMLARSELLGTVGGGRVLLRDPNTQGEMRITVDNGELRADRGKPVRLTLDGALDGIPMVLAIDTARADELVNPKLPLPFKLRAAGANTRVDLAGTIARPIGSELQLALDAHGARFDDLNPLVRASLPPWGPWSAAGKFRMSPRGYEVNDLRLRVGSSVLDGHGRLDTASGRPNIVIALSAPVIQLDDFKPGDWSPFEKKPGQTPTTLTEQDIRRKAAEASARAQKLLSPAMLSRQDASLTVEVKQVLSGQDKLGAGRLQAKLANGRADIGPIEVEIPGGAATLHLGYEPTDQDVKVDFRLEIEKFDYGVLARMIKPETDLAGKFSVKMDVDARTRYLSEILRHGNGRIEFAVWPQNMKSGVFDLWAVNVLVALVPAVDPNKASKVNCAIGRFVLEDGILIDKRIVLDTSKMRVTGSGRANFEQEQFTLRMRPQAKTAQFLSLATPIKVSGAFGNFEINVSPGDVFETIARLATSIVWVPLQKLAGNTLPADGTDVCSNPLQGAPEQ